jgi:hypothetical protein
MAFGTAMGRLRKAIMFEMAGKLGMLNCHRCSQPITDIDQFSIDHTEAWETAENPIETFFDLNKIAFSHLRCNVGAGSKPNKKYVDAKERSRVQFSRFYAKHGDAWNAIRNERRRKPRFVQR